MTLCLIQKQSNMHAFGEPLLIYPQMTIYYYSTVTAYQRRKEKKKVLEKGF